MRLIKIIMPDGKPRIVNFKMLELENNATEEEIGSAVFKYICWNVTYDYEILK